MGRDSAANKLCGTRRSSATTSWDIPTTWPTGPAEAGDLANCQSFKLLPCQPETADDVHLTPRNNVHASLCKVLAFNELPEMMFMPRLCKVLAFNELPEMMFMPRLCKVLAFNERPQTL